MRGVMELVDNGINMARHLSVLLKDHAKLKVFSDSRPLLESIGSSKQVEEKSLYQPVVFLKQNLEGEEVKSFAWIGGKDIIAYM